MVSVFRTAGIGFLLEGIVTTHTCIAVDLKPCPFCGGQADFNNDGERWHQVICGSCGCRGCEYPDDRQKAAASWNRRAAARPQQIPSGWFVHVDGTGFVQVAKEHEGEEDTIPLYSAQPQRSVASEHPISQGMLRTQEIMCAADMEAKIAALAHRFWSIHPSSIDDMGLTREEFYAREMKKLLIPVEPQTLSVREAAIEECAKVVEPKGPRPCDCERCYCGNHGDMEAVAAWDADAHNAKAIRALASEGK